MTRNLIILALVSHFLMSKPTSLSEKETSSTSDPIRIIKKITRFESGNEIVTDSVEFEYDNFGRLTSIIDLKTQKPRNRFYYKDALVSRIITFNETGEVTSDISGRHKESADKEKILLDYSRAKPAGGTDTIQVVYDFKENRVQKIGIYVHLDSLPFSFDKRVYKYNSLGNLTDLRQVTTNEDSSSVIRVIEWDKNKNPFYEMSASNFIFMAKNFPFNCQSVNNPIKYIDYLNRTVTAEVTYNVAGYPLTYKRSVDDFISDEFVYHR